MALAKIRAGEDEGEGKGGPARCHDAIPKVGALTYTVGPAFRLAGLLKVRIAFAEKTILEENLPKIKVSMVLLERLCKNIKEDEKDISCCKYFIQTNARKDEGGDDNYDIGNRGIGDAESELGQVAYEGLARRNKK